ncbi:MAG: nicotinate-nucleotide diphosphorylase, partial [Flavobacteriales bacterium]
MENTTSDQLTLLRLALTEDIGDGNHTSLATVGADLIGIGTVKAKSAGVVAGITVGMAVARLVDSAILVTPMVFDGTEVTAGTELMTLKGPVRSLLSTERLLLNCMQRMSGIATLTRRYVDKLKGSKTRLLDTRKNT